MINNLILENLLLLDIETVPACIAFEGLTPMMQNLWLDKFAKTTPEIDQAILRYADRAGIFAEFGKVICISVGYFHKEADQYYLRVKSFYGDEEKEILQQFLKSVDQFCQRKKDLFFAGHNLREFDIPYICRRALVHQLALPPLLQLHGLRPWEVHMVDTLHLWRFGDIKHYTSLKLLAAVLDVPTPKDDIDGSMVSKVYWEEHDLLRIALYCQKDVVTVAQLLLRFKNMPLLQQENIELVK